MLEGLRRIHLGHNVRRIREIRGFKQEALAAELKVSQQAVSLLEQSEHLDDETIEKAASFLGVTPEAIRNFSDESVVNYFNTFNDHSFSHSSGVFHANGCTFNPIDKLIGMIEENKTLYERLLQSEREKNELLQKQLKEKSQ